MSLTKTKQKRIVLFAICMLLEAVFTFLFFNQIINMDNGSYASDLPIHILIAIQDNSYSLIYYLIKLLYLHNNGALFVALFFAALVVLNFFVTVLFVDKYFSIGYYKSILTAFILTFLSKIYLPVDASDYFYYEPFENGISFSMITQPWHNITYSGMRLLLVITLYFFFDIASRYMSDFKAKDYLLLSIFMAISTAVKPNFFLFFSVSILIMLIIDFIKDKITLKKFYRCTLFATTVLPSFLILYLQSKVLYSGAEQKESGIVFALKDSILFELGEKRICLILLTSFAFPFIVWLFNCKNEVHKRNRILTDIMFLVAFLETTFLRETGSRKYDYNFLWTILGASYVLFLMYVPLFFENVKDIEHTTKNKIYISFGAVILALNFFCGICYFVYQMLGNGYIG